MARKRQWGLVISFVLLCGLGLIARDLFLNHPHRLQIGGIGKRHGNLMRSYFAYGLLLIAGFLFSFLNPRYPKGLLLTLPLACLASLLPGLGAFRVDLGILYFLFLSISAAIGIQHLWQYRIAGLRIGITALLLITLSLSLWGGWIRMWDFNRLSLNSISRTGRVLSGQIGQSLAYVPAHRQERIKAFYVARNIPMDARFTSWWNEAMAKAADEKRFLPTSEHLPYRYAWDFLSSQPTYRKIMTLRLQRALDP